ncbi:MAG: hypothetical protein US71_C0005G0019 [Parcubacteria group bacterium GW2011_GWD2_38_12]|nr:MAG: hypothetical protein US06_C0005G0016 [Parcubacteria group bacterium GW2011_GWC2_36_17]KKQ42284.1 MAG: hypothetical protein US61_C0029G0003 [Parcubacteria group bacterium GW2011_GWE2_37_8]KKQ52169.1 MAG: hypothetical protein US71_C0005G0019 [Parcubacteria group bacterium GW2011_GWD2_38_12]KKQ58895.1 MAG: hypothetical protein US79_C0002G0083 [Parcubacteria group bacterium GW2011_GWC1_38_17]KKQ59538.1 MAG: hypothetical protein US78_C0002G0001 [Parcubacteria group bacterium GW2011_GWD1_38_1
MSEQIYLSVVIPAYNEEHRIGKSLVELDQYLSKQSYIYEILVINDGAKDRTVDVVREAMKTVKNLRLIDNKENHGKGYVVRQGMLEAKGKYRLFSDADSSVSIEQIEKFWPYFEQGYDVVIGSIEVAGAKIEEHAAWYRRFVGHWAKLLIRMLAIWEIHDTQRGFKCFTAKAAQDVFLRQTITRWGFDIEILVIAKEHRYKIKEVPVVWINPGESKVGASAYISTLKELLQIKWNLIKGKYR